MKHPILRIIVIGIIINTVLLLIGLQKADASSIKQDLPCQQWHGALRKAGLPVEIFAPIMWRESRCTPQAIGWNYHKGKSEDDCRLSHASTYRQCKAVKSYDTGLLQINSTWVTLTKTTCKAKDMLILQKPWCNLKVAAVLWNGGKGVSHWRATSNANMKHK